MKNLYLLPTDKPSRLHDYNYTSLLGLSKEYLQWRQGMHIYITSNERIKERDYVLSDTSIGALYLDGVVNTVKMLAENQWKKVILTTDPELIEDGVQIISDKFLEWFVKNPSCEFAEYDNSYNRGNGKYYYKVITPKEKVKHEARVLSKEEVMSERSSAYEFIDFNKKQTIEEAGENYIKKYPQDEVRKICFIEGAKWQQERDYSEEEVINILVGFSEEIKNISNITEWFEQFKK